MPDPQLTPEQEIIAQEVFNRRRQDPEAYEREIMGPEIAPALQVAIAAGELENIEFPTQSSQEVVDELGRQKQESDRLARDFCFLDPADYADEQARIGRVLTPAQLLDLLQTGCQLQCWYSLADMGVVQRELNPRDVALAKLKIGEDPKNLTDMRRWRDAIREVRQEERKRRPIRDYELVALQVCRAPGKPEYCCWVPACHLREYDLVRFDSHGVPADLPIRGWRTVLLQLVMKRFVDEATITRVFGQAAGPASKRYLMILQGLRNRPEKDDEGEAVPAFGSLPTAADLDAVAVEDEARQATIARCPDCNWAYGEHRPDCALSAYEQQQGNCGKNMGNDLLIIPCDLPKGHSGPCERNHWPVDPT